MASKPTEAGDALAYVQEALNIVSWMWEAGADTVRWYGDASAMLGLPPGAHEGTFAAYERRLHPDDRTAARRRLGECVRGTRDGYQAVERVIWPDGSVHWLEVHGRRFADAQGRTVRLVGVQRDVTERVLADEARVRSEQRFHDLIRHAPLAIGMSRGPRVIYANAGFTRLFGYAQADDVLGIPVIELVAPHEREAFTRRSELRAQGAAVEVSFETDMLRRDGSSFACLVSVTAVDLPDGAAQLVFLHDLSDRRRAEQAARDEHLRNQQYLDAAQAPLLVLDAEGRIALLNRRGHELLGYEQGSVVGWHWFTLVYAREEAARQVAFYRRLMAGHEGEGGLFEVENLTRDGSARRMIWRSVLLRDAEGTLVGTLSSGEDVTERRAAERALSALNAQLEQRVRERTEELAVARDAAEAATLAKSRFLANMSHEIRTPMNAVIGLSDLAQRHAEPGSTVHGYLGNIRRAALSLLEVINDILDFSKIEAGRLDIVESDFVLAELVEQVRSLTQVRAAEKGLALEVQVDAALPARLHGDALRIGQVLINLCGNAVKFTDAGSVTLRLQRMEPTVDGSGEGDAPLHLRCSVADTGIGIGPEGLARLFSPFDQLDASNTRRHGGTGLGLAISRQLVELMGGQIGVVSSPGRGSTFSVELPLRKAVGQGVVSPDPAPSAAARPAWRLQGRRILLVEDNELNQVVACDYLEGQAGAVVEVARTGAEALAALERSQFDLVLMDVQMPVMDGYEATRRLRADPRHAALPIVAMTAHALPADHQRSRAAGMNAHLTKPIDPQRLFELIATLLDDGGGSAGPAASAPAPDPAPTAADTCFDPVRGLQRCLGRDDLFHTILQRFAETRADDVAALHGALAAGRASAAAQLAHMVVSSAALVGAEGLSDLARRLQMALDANDRAAWPSLVADFSAAHTAVMAAIRAHLAAR